MPTEEPIAASECAKHWQSVHVPFIVRNFQERPYLSSKGLLREYARANGSYGLIETGRTVMGARQEATL